MRVRTRASLAAGFLGLAAMLGAGVDDGVRVSAPVTKAGITCRVQGVNATTALNLDTGMEGKRVRRAEAQHTISVQLTLEGEAVFIATQGEILTLLDQREHDVLTPQQVAEMPPEQARQALEEALRSGLQRDRSQRTYVNAHRYLERFPATIMKLTGSVPVMMAHTLTRAVIKPVVSAEAVEIAPGVTFLLTLAEQRDGQWAIGYEVRTRRGLKGITPGREPVFGGLLVRDAGGQIRQHLYYGQQVETRDEYILVVKEVGVADEYMRSGTLEACVFVGLEELNFDFEIANMPLATGDK